MIYLRKRSLFCFEIRLVAMDMQSSLYFSLSVWETQTSCLLPFPTFFQVAANCGFRCTEVKFYFSSTWYRSYSSNFLKTPGSWSLTFPQRKHWKTISDLEVSNYNLTINTTNVLSYFCSVFLFLNLHKITCHMYIFQFLHFTGERYSYLPTPSLEQDMTQCEFLSGV